MDLQKIGQTARNSARKLSQISTLQKNEFLALMAEHLRYYSETILAANQADIKQAKSAGLNIAMIDRLMLTQVRLDGISKDLEDLIAMPDPVGAIIEQKTLPNSLKARRVRVPLGVMAVIYEARPNVTVDISALGIKSGNAVILRGGKETLNSNKALVQVIQDCLEVAHIPVEAVQFIDDPDRELVNQLVRMDQYVDLLIPRGGNALQDFCKANATMPVMTGGIGICHLFVDESADLDKAVEVIHNAKVQRPSVCNALDTLLVHTSVAREFLPKVAERLIQEKVQLKCDQNVLKYLEMDLEKGILSAEDGDFDQEWLSLVLGIRVVDSIDAAIHHIHEHSTQHSDGILTENREHAQRFVNEIDSAAVYVNASTRFTDGAQLGLGGEVAVSTQKLHARGPIGLEGLTTYKWVLEGEYTVRP
ncbi:MAG: glutamate-5-semialdehyde dehydrogenase [Chloroflexi bacterium HGW-Chloroflexi-3]|nr:MAG: glutamate-5-semialdehyde dehydrogenase [Chloroflexi bacterium HGW-Chloroflexi-3]